VPTRYERANKRPCGDFLAHKRQKGAVARGSRPIAGPLVPAITEPSGHPLKAEVGGETQALIHTPT